MTDDDSLRAAFDRFHAENPRVYELLCYFADVAIRAGRERYSINGLFERLRWHFYIETKDESGFKLNNSYRSFYARLWLADHPDRPSFFETRALRSEPPGPGPFGRGSAS